MAEAISEASDAEVLDSRKLVVEKLLHKLLAEQVKLHLKKRKRKRKKIVIHISSGNERRQSQKSQLLKNPPGRRLLRKSLVRSRW